MSNNNQRYNNNESNNGYQDQNTNYYDNYQNQEFLNYNENNYDQSQIYNDNYQNQEMYNGQYSQDVNYNGNLQNQNTEYNDQYNEGLNSYDINYQDQNMNYNTYNDNNQFQTNNQEYYEQNDNNFNPVYEEYAEPKKRTGIILLVSFLIIGLIAISGYFAYNKYIVNKKAVVDLNQYEIEFKPYGTDGDGTAAADIKKIPTVENADGSVTQFLQEPTITYSKSNNLKNGEKVEVTISLSKSSADAKKRELKGEFKRSCTVKGLSE